MEPESHGARPESQTFFSEIPTRISGHGKVVGVSPNLGSLVALTKRVLDSEKCLYDSGNLTHETMGK